MSRSRRRRWRVWLASAASALCLASSARAQILYDEAQRALGLSPDPLERSARPIGMGRLTLVLPDVNNRITMWDFAGNPTGVLEADSVSSLELRPGGWTSSAAHEAEDASGSFERQSFASAQGRLGYEGWRRSAATVFGAVGEFSALRTDSPVDDTEESRARFNRPRGTAVLNGRMPFVLTNRMHYALRLGASSEELRDDFRLIVRNAAGEYLNKEGTLVGPPNRFDPDESHVATTGFGGALSIAAAPWVTIAAGADFVVQKIRSQNSGDRHLNEYDEDRPYGVGQVSAIGRAGPSVEWGLDARGWSASSNRTFVSTNSAGIAAVPIAGRGDMYDRDEEGSTLRARARWAQGPWEAGASYGSDYRHWEITPPPVTDRSSFNAYLGEIFYDARADSIALPDSILHEISERRAVRFAAGAGWRPRAVGGAIGLEFHVWRDRLDQLSSGAGPKQVGWDVRSGVDWPLTAVLAGRAGFIHRWEDLDDFTDQNEYLSNTVTAGAGYQPVGGHWRFESGYAFEWGRADFGSPAQQRFTRQQLAAQLKWAF